jgi:hypothetical protein
MLFAFHQPLPNQQLEILVSHQLTEQRKKGYSAGQPWEEDARRTKSNVTASEVMHDLLPIGPSAPAR